MGNLFYAYLYFALAVAALIYYVYCLWKEQNSYDENVKKYMKGDLEEYFEVKYIRKSYFAIIWICFPLGILCVHVLLSSVDTSSLNWWGLVLVGILLLTAPSICYIYKSRQKIIYDHGEIRYCIGNKVHVSGSIYNVDREQSYIWQAVEGVNTETSLIMFISGDRIFFERKSMDYGYKLEALMTKKELYIDEWANAISELREEYGEDKDLDELERLMKGYDEKNK